MTAAVLWLAACGGQAPSSATQAPATSGPGNYPGPPLTPLATATPFAYPASEATATTAPATTAGPVEIVYRNFEIVPASITVKVGTPVVFLIKDGLHQPYNATAPNTFEAPAGLGDGATFPYTFTEAGTTTILCGYHKNMQAVVVVEP